MLTMIVIVALAYGYLLYVTKFLTIRLLVGAEAKPKYARYEAYNMMRKGKPGWNDRPIHEGNNYPEGHSPNGEP